MEHPICQIREVEVVGPYTLNVRFTDNTEQVIN